jgi:hypothetical protein
MNANRTGRAEATRLGKVAGSPGSLPLKQDFPISEISVEDPCDVKAVSIY